MQSSEIQRVAIIAGAGDLPKTLYASLENAFVVGLKGFCNPETWAEDYVVHPLEKIGKIIEALHKQKITHIVLAGGLERPSFTNLSPDALGKVVVKQWLKTQGGDDSLLRVVIKFFEQQNFTVMGVDDILGQQKVCQGILTSISPNPEQREDIEKGFHILSAQSDLDIGQSVVIQEKMVIAIEAIEGTDAMISRSADLKRDGTYGPILIKAMKKNQTRNADLPTIGVDTVKNLAKSGFSGMAISSEGIIILDIDTVIKTANDLGIFIISV